MTDKVIQSQTSGLYIPPEKSDSQLK